VSETVTVTGTKISDGRDARHGETVLENAASSPSWGIGNFLDCHVRQDKGGGTDLIVIQGVKRLSGTAYEVCPIDRNGGHYLVAAPLPAHIQREEYPPDHLDAVIDKLKKPALRGDEAIPGSMSICAKMPHRHRHRTHPSRLSHRHAARSSALIRVQRRRNHHRNDFRDRFMHMLRCGRMGSEIRPGRQHSIIKGVERLTAAHVDATFYALG